VLSNTVKKILSIFIAAAMVAPLFAYAPVARADFGNFTYSGNYPVGQYSDVSEMDWFGPYVRDACNLGLFKGKSAEIFDPGGSLTLGEAVTLAVRLRSIFHTGKADFIESAPYYSVYADYALSHGIIAGHGDYNAPVTRARFAVLIYKALPPSAFTELVPIPEYGICDVAPKAEYGAAVYALYRAGVLSGSDRFGTFFPELVLTRAEACTVMVRAADPSARILSKFPRQIPAEEIFRRNADAVFMIETFDRHGLPIRTGSGFFISDDGLAVTNLHVIMNAASAAITLYNGDVFSISGVRAISTENNLVVFSVDSGKGGFCHLVLADSDLIEVGNTVYALGSPRALLNSITEGVISNTKRVLNEETFIQFSAPISFGSGGSPVLNELGQVVGVASSFISSGQHLNLAVPVNFIKELEPGELVTLSALLVFLQSI